MNKPFSINAEIFDQIYSSYTSAVELARGHSYSEEELVVPGPVSASQLRAFIESAFWASLQHEEGRFHEFSLVLLPKEVPISPFVFDRPEVLSDHKLAKLAPALDPLANSIGVWPGEDGELYLWGFAPLGDTGMTETSLSATTIAPGQILLSCTELGGIVHFTVLITGTRAEFVERGGFLAWVVPESREIEGQRLNLSLLWPALDLRTIATFMRAHKHGGTLLIVQPESKWTASIVQPMRFSGPPYLKIRLEVSRRNEAHEKEKAARTFLIDSDRYKRALDNANKYLQTIARLTAVDGATVITMDLDVLAFGVKIHPIDEDVKPDTVLITEPFKESKPREIELSVLGGTRHQSAAQFVFDQKDAIAFVASQDGRVSAMRWDPEEKKVTIIRPAEFSLL
jgi:hypothetical protein